MQGAFPTDPDTGGNSPRFVPPTVEELGSKFPQLDILKFVGQGGMGAVYKARQKQLERVVALKILPPGIGEDPAFAERFTREAKALAKLNHPGVVTIYEFGCADGLYFFLMEFVDGLNLRQLLDGGRVSPREALAIVPQICDALQYAHDNGIVHRDIKPENILLDRQGRVKVADFGVAKLVGDAEATASGSPTLAAAVTEAGQVMGTPQYMAPEQREHPGEVDHRADIYSLGVVFYQMLTGQLPGRSVEAPSRKVQIDVRLDAVVLRALEKKPELRYQQASDVKTMVETIATTPPAAGSAGVPPVIPCDAPTSPSTHFNPWQPALYGIGLVVYLVLFLTGLGAPVPVNAICFVLGTIGGGVALLKLSGYWPWGSPLFPQSNWTGRNLHSSATAWPGESRFSRTAIVGAAWLTLFFAVMPAFFWHEVKTHEFENHGPFASALMVFVFFVFIFPAFTAPFGMTVLGWIAVTQIRRSAGKIYGLGLAVFDGLLFPLLLLDGVFVWVSRKLVRIFVEFNSNFSNLTNPQVHPPLITRLANLLSQHSELIAFAIVALLVTADFFIIRAVWRAVIKSVSNGNTSPPAISSIIKLLAIVGAVAALIAFAVGVTAPLVTRLPALSKASPSPVSSTFASVVERVLPFDRSVIDFQTGTILRPDLEKRPPVNPEEWDAWRKRTGADAMVEEKSQFNLDPDGFPRLVSLQGLIPEESCAFVGDASADFDSMRPKDAEAKLKPATSGKFSWTLAYGRFPWWFRTRDGATGVLQILGVSDNPRGLKIRYKLIQGGGVELRHQVKDINQWTR